MLRLNLWSDSMKALLTLLLLMFLLLVLPIGIQIIAIISILILNLIFKLWWVILVIILGVWLASKI